MTNSDLPFLLYQFFKTSENFSIENLWWGGEQYENFIDFEKSKSLKVREISKLKPWLSKFISLEKISDSDLADVFFKVFPESEIRVLYLDEVSFQNNDHDIQLSAKSYEIKNIPIENQSDFKILESQYFSGSHDPEGELIYSPTIKSGLYIFKDKDNFCNYLKFDKGKSRRSHSRILFTEPIIDEFPKYLTNILDKWENEKIKVSDRRFLESGRNPMDPDQQKDKLKKFLIEEYGNNNNNLIFDITNEFKNFHIFIDLFYFESSKYITIKALALDKNEIRCVLDYLPKLTSLIIEKEVSNTNNEFSYGKDWTLFWNEETPWIEYGGKIIRTKKKGLRKGYLILLKELLSRPKDTVLTYESIGELMKWDACYPTSRAHNAKKNLMDYGKAYFIETNYGEGWFIKK